MKSDVLALGFITDKDDAVLFRVDSGTSQDYLELEIVSTMVRSRYTKNYKEALNVSCCKSDFQISIYCF